MTSSHSDAVFPELEPESPDGSPDSNPPPVDGTGSDSPHARSRSESGSTTDGDRGANDRAPDEVSSEGDPADSDFGLEDADEEIVEVLKSIFDPEIPVNIYELGLIYGIRRDESDDVTIRMTLTSPNCPVAESLPRDVRDKVAALDSVGSVQVDLVWDPTWTPEQMSEEARLELGLW